ncbi:patched domain-containing protein 3-like [Centruroides sculpturatus]|uniref:patched domain-containing protein 3-like n=1 Tax=Centruroides sculpturatus TaxID=218467 RepID=UPI000C6CDC42|nr:patched domain-containing protein 3-like [Centruroides sculpturatus]
MGIGCAKKLISAIFRKLGRLIGLHPYYFIIFPILITASFSVFVVNLKTLSDIVDLTVADRGKVFNTKKFIEQTFPFNTSTFLDPLRFTTIPKFAFAMFTRKDGENMLEKNVFLEIKSVDELIRNITVIVEGREIKYNDICGRIHQKCFENPIIEILPEVDDIISKKKVLKFPVDIDPLTFSYRIYSLNFGGVTTKENDVIKTVEAMKLVYFVDESDQEKCSIGVFWSMEDEILSLNKNLEPMIGAVFVFVTVFCMVTCMSNSWAKSKPFLGLASVVSAGLAVVTSFGLMSILGIQNTIWNISIPFLVLVTEIDDAFVLIACWRISNPKHKVYKRMEKTFGEAGVSITLTTLTNFFSYCIENIEDDLEEDQKSADEPMMTFFRDKLGNLLSNTLMKITVIIIFLVNLSIGVWGALTINQGLDFIKLFPEGSPVANGTAMIYKYFGRYPYGCQIIINTTLDYSDVNVQKSIERLQKKFESLPYIAESRFSTSWLKYYKEFQHQPIAKYSLQGYNMSIKQDFIDGLRNVFLRFEAAKQFSNDIVFNENQSEISCSRFYVAVSDILNREAGMELLNNLLKTAEESEYPVLVHTPMSGMNEQGIIIERTIKDVFWITSVLIMILFLLFIPSVVSAILVAISVVSTIVETLGYMSLWGVNMDILSMMSLILCVGFCVNYPAHISYAFVSSSYKSPNEKLKDVLYHIGYPICQGSLSTIFGILFLYRDMYAYMIFVKIVLLIAIETAFHALFFIPVTHSYISSIFHKNNFSK